MKKVLLILIFLKILYSFEVVKKWEVFLSQKKVVLKEPVAFVVKERRIYVLDIRAADIKIYDNTGELLRTFGRKGQGPNEFLNPIALSSWREFLLIYDFKRGKIFLYKISPEGEIKFYRSYIFQAFAFIFKFLNSQELLISGHSMTRKNGKTYSVFIFNLVKGTYEYLLPSFVAYGVKNEREYEKKFLNELVVLSPENYADYCGGEIYFASAADFHILKRDKKGRVKYFGRKSAKFYTPLVTKEMKKAVWRRQDAKLAELLSKFSFVEGLFCTKKGMISLIFSSPAEEGRDVYIQIYNGEGEFLKEYKLMHTEAETESEILAYFSQKENKLFFLTAETAAGFGVNFKITGFKIREE